MLRVFWIVAIGVLATATPIRAQDPGPERRDGEIVIPSERAIEREIGTQPRNDFSTDDAIATQQMNRQNRQIDREIESEICSDC